MTSSAAQNRARYLGLLKKALVNALYGADERGFRDELSPELLERMRASIAAASDEYRAPTTTTPTFLDVGEDRLKESAAVMLSRFRHTMLEPRYLDSLEECWKRSSATASPVIS